MKGIYTLILQMSETATIVTGRLGGICYQSGYYAYTGSARAKSGFSRIRRHIDVAKGINKTRHWHIDYLLPRTAIQAIIATSTERDLECQISNCIGRGATPIIGFGCTDCGCLSHLYYHTDQERIIEEALNAYRRYAENIHQWEFRLEGEEIVAVYPTPTKTSATTPSRWDREWMELSR
mgnify:CR=1 FL=1